MSNRVNSTGPVLYKKRVHLNFKIYFGTNDVFYQGNTVDIKKIRKPMISH